MKTLLTCSMILLVFSYGFAQQPTIHVANNNTNAPIGDHIYKSLQEAVNAASAGDIIHVVPSVTDYGEVTIEKKLAIYGIGFYPDKDIRLISLVRNLYIGPNASGTQISGLVIIDHIGLAPNSSSTYSLNDIVIANCEVPRIYRECCNANILSNILIKSCVIRDYIALPNDATLSNALITNNIIFGYISAGNATLINHNIFISTLGSGNKAFDYLSYCVVTNNIFYGRSPQSINVSEGNQFNNNLSSGTNDLPPPASGVGNIGSNNIFADPQFTKVTSTTSYIFTDDFRLKAMSPGKGKGSDGTEIGVFGGTTPFKPNGTPLPLIQVLNTSGVINKNDSLKITVKALAN